MSVSRPSPAATLPWAEAPPIVQTPRLLLRPPLPGDAPALARLIDNFNVVRYLAEVPFPYDRAAADAWIQRCAAAWADGTERQFAIERADDGRLVGHIGLRFGRDRSVADIGYWIGQAYWGRGFAAEAAVAAVSDAFRTAGVDSLLAACLPENRASRALLDRLGFREAGSHWQSFAARRERVPVPVLRLDRRAWHGLAGISGDGPSTSRPVG